MKNWKDKCENTFSFCDGDIINKFTSLLHKVAYPCKYMEEWDKFNQDFFNQDWRFLQKFKSRKYQQMQLQSRKKSLEYFPSEKSWWLSRTICEKCFSKISWNVS